MPWRSAKVGGVYSADQWPGKRAWQQHKKKILSWMRIWRQHKSVEIYNSQERIRDIINAKEVTSVNDLYDCINGRIEKKQYHYINWWCSSVLNPAFTAFQMKSSNNKNFWKWESQIMRCLGTFY